MLKQHVCVSDTKLLKVTLFMLFLKVDLIQHSSTMCLEDESFKT